MPQLAAELLDNAGLANVAGWIGSLHLARGPLTPAARTNLPRPAPIAYGIALGDQRPPLGTGARVGSMTAGSEALRPFVVKGAAGARSGGQS